MPTRNLTVRVSEGPSDANTIVRLIIIMLVAAVVFGAAYFFLAYVVGPVINFVVLALMAVSGVALLGYSNPELDGININQSELAVRTELFRRKKKDPHITEDDYYRTFKSAGIVTTIFLVLAVAVVAGYAMNPRYQIFPVNYFGFGTLIVVVGVAAAAMGVLATIEGIKTRPYKRKNLSVVVANKALGFVLLAYPTLILAVKVGIIR